MREQTTALRPSVAIVKAIADVERVDPTELGVRLTEYIDLDALDRLAAHGGDWRLEFSVAAHTVCVGSDGTVAVDGQSSQYYSSIRNR